MSDVWVVNASPVISLAKADRLHLLDDLCLHLDDKMVRSALEGAEETWEQG